MAYIRVPSAISCVQNMACVWERKEDILPKIFHVGPACPA